MTTNSPTSLPTLPLSDGGTMPAWGLGTHSHQGPAGADLFAEAINDGHRLLDTAAQYGNEAAVGAGVARSGVAREELFITTKIAGGDQGLGATRTGLENSLRRLEMDYVDLTLIHWPNPSRDLFIQTWEELVRLREEGKTRHIGVSNFLPEHIEKIADATGVWPVLNQVQLHPMIARTDLVNYHRDHDIVTEAWRPLGFKENLLEQVTVLNIAEDVGRSPAQVVLRWAVQRGIVPIAVSSKPERNRENLTIGDFELSERHMSLLAGFDAGDRYLWDPNTHEEW